MRWGGRRRIPRFPPILDFFLVLSYLFVLAKALHPDDRAEAWHRDVDWMTGSWQGRVTELLNELRTEAAALGAPPDDAPDAC